MLAVDFMKTVIHHSADYDGIFCREIAKHFLGTEGVTYIGWDFKDPPLSVPEGVIYVLDLPLDVTFGGKPGEFNLGVLSAIDTNHLFWIDHHKSAIESHPQETGGYRIDGVAACRLAWQWFSGHHHDPTCESCRLPDKAEYLARQVKEPLAVRLAGEYDIWDHRGDGDLEFQFGLRSEKDLKWEWLLDTTSAGCDSYAKQLVAQGKLIMEYSRGVDASVIKANSFLLDWEGLKFLALNTARCNSLTFAAKDVPETGHDALLAFYTNGKKWTVSTYHAARRKDIDLSLIAVKHGGGGHKGACGFTCDKLPWL